MNDSNEINPNTLILPIAMKLLIEVEDFEDDDYDSDNGCYDNGAELLEEPTTVSYSPHYKVEMRAFKTGNWYTKTETDYVRSAYSVAHYNNFGRAYRLTDQKQDGYYWKLMKKRVPAELASEYRKYY